VGETTVLTLLGGRVIDATARAPIEDRIVSIEGARITAVGKRSDLGGDVAGTIIDCDGCTVLPGLFNCHLHLALDGNQASETGPNARSRTGIHLHGTGDAEP
jgi:imidazolonepropionase-like amidohydrolase